MASRIDFKYLKEQADFLVVLKHYRIEVFGRGVARSIHCPFHEDKKPSCKINLGRKGYHCFGCGAHGNILTFVQKKEDLDEDELRAAARKLADICGLELVPPTGDPSRRATRPGEWGSGVETMQEPSEAQTPHHEASVASGEVAADIAANEPLSAEFVERFRAKLEPYHPYFEERGLTPAIVATFGLSYFAADKGMMRNRIVIPIHNEAGELLAWAGRFVGPDEELPEGHGKYLLPPKFYKQRCLYNLHRVRGKKHLVVVEGYFAVFRLFALGVPAVAFMGSSLSEAQVDLLRGAGVKYLTVLLDGDDAGRNAVPAMMARLSREPFLVKFGLLPEGTQPDTVDEAFLAELLRLKL
jgi:DNA primase